MNYKLLSILLLIICSIKTYGQSKQVDIPDVISFGNINLIISRPGKERINEKIESLTKSKVHYQNFVERCHLFFPHIDQVLKQEGVPQEFKYLALQESALSADATSKTEAVGFWQFKDFTAMESGMRIDNDIDERKHILTSTKAAARYLRKNHFLSKNWLHALLSYNLGYSGASNHIEPKKIESTEINHETHQYIIHFLAHMLAFNNTDELNHSGFVLLQMDEVKGKRLDDIANEAGIDLYELLEYNTWITSDKIPSDKDYSVMVPADFNEPDTKVFTLKNIHYPVLKNTSPEFPEEEKLVVASENTDSKEEIDLTLPAWKRFEAETFPQQAIYPIKYNPVEKEVGGFTFTFFTANDLPAVISHESLDAEKFCQLFDIKLSKFKKYNDLKETDWLKKNQLYYFQKKKSKLSANFHTVIGEKNLWEVAQRYGICLKPLMRRNKGLSFSNLKRGTVIWLSQKRKRKNPVEIKNIQIPEYKPKKTNSPISLGITVADTKIEKENTSLKEMNVSEEKVFASEKLALHDPSEFKYHKVNEGENLFLLSQIYDVTIYELSKVNNIDTIEPLQKGQIIKIPTIKKIEIAKYVAESSPSKPKTRNTTIRAKSKKPRSYKVADVPQKNIYTVKRGDSLWKIAKDQKISVTNLVAWNDLPGTRIDIGQKLIIRPPETKNTPSSKNNEITKPTTTAVSPSTIFHKVRRGETLYSLSKRYNVATREILKWNGMKESFALKIGDKIIVSDPTISDKKEPSSKKEFHTVRSGESLSVIAAKYKIPIEYLRKWNDLWKSDLIRTGQKIYLTEKPESNISEKPNSSNSEKLVETYHNVKRGESLYSISKKYDVKISDIKSWNNLKTSSLDVGDKLLIKSKERSKINTDAVTNTDSKTKYHIAEKGDTLYSLSKKYGISVSKIKELNNRKSDALKEGEKIIVTWKP